MKHAVTSRTGRHGGQTCGQAAADGRFVEPNQTAVAGASTQTQGWKAAHSRSPDPDGHSVCAEDRDWLGGLAQGDGLRQRHDLLAALTRLAVDRHLGQAACHVVSQSERGGPNRLVQSHRRQQFRACCFGGAKTGPSPTDRRKNGSKHHAITDANGIPLAALLTGANRHDITQLLPLVEAIGPVGGKPGRPRKRPAIVQGDRAYDSNPLRQSLRDRGITPCIARRYTENGSGLGVTRWVIERTLSWLHQFRRLRVRYERRADTHEAFLAIGCSLICWRFLNKGFC